jgi:hypothetical protein
VGPATAYKLLKEHKNIENVLEVVREKPRYFIPDPFPYPQVRELFIKPEVIENTEALEVIFDKLILILA